MHSRVLLADPLPYGFHILAVNVRIAPISVPAEPEIVGKGRGCIRHGRTGCGRRCLNLALPKHAARIFCPVCIAVNYVRRYETIRASTATNLRVS